MKLADGGVGLVKLPGADELGGINLGTFHLRKKPRSHLAELVRLPHAGPKPHRPIVCASRRGDLA
jgi:hypothetical protein